MSTPITRGTATPPDELRGLFEPITLRNAEVRNRIVVTGHGTGVAKDFLPSEQHVAARAI